MKSTKIIAKSVRTVHNKVSRPYYNTQNYNNSNELCSEDEYQIVEKISEEAACKDQEFDIRRQSGYWQARNMFLKSYIFSKDNKEGWKKKMKRKAKETNMKAKLALVDMGRKAMMVRGKKFEVKMLDLKMDLMSAAIVKCFVPSYGAYYGSY